MAIPPWPWVRSKIGLEVVKLGERACNSGLHRLVVHDERREVGVLSCLLVMSWQSMRVRVVLSGSLWVATVSSDASISWISRSIRHACARTKADFRTQERIRVDASDSGSRSWCSRAGGPRATSSPPRTLRRARALCATQFDGDSPRQQVEVGFARSRARPWSFVCQCVRWRHRVTWCWMFSACIRVLCMLISSYGMCCVMDTERKHILQKFHDSLHTLGSGAQFRTFAAEPNRVTLKAQLSMLQ